MKSQALPANLFRSHFVFVVLSVLFPLNTHGAPFAREIHPAGNIRAGAFSKVIEVPKASSGDLPLVTLSHSDISISENGGKDFITATLNSSGPDDVAVTIRAKASGTATAAVDFSLPASILIPAGSLTAQVELSSINDNLVESDETVTVEILSVMNGVESGIQEVATTIIDEDKATLIVESGANAIEAFTDGHFRILTNKQFDKNVTIGISVIGTATAGIDYTAITSSQLFPAYADTLIVPVQQLDDSDSEINEYVIINLETTNNASVKIAPAPDSTATVTLYDDDRPLVTLSQSATAFSEAAGQNTLTAHLNQPLHTDVVITIGIVLPGTATAGTDFTFPPTITIQAGYLTGTADLTAIQDRLVESDETLTIDILSVTNGIENGTQRVSSKITDDDEATLLIQPGANAIENISDGHFRIITDKQFDKDVTVGISIVGTATAGVDYTAIPNSQLFPANTDTLLVPVNQLDDSDSEVSEYVIANLVSTDHARVHIAPAPDSTAQVTLFDDDLPLITLSQSVTTFSEAVGENTLTAHLNKVHYNDVVITIGIGLPGTATSGTDFTFPPAITILAGSLTGTATLSAIQDQLVESDETLTIDILSVTNGVENGTQRVSSTIIDDDTAILSVVATTQAAEDATDGLFTITTNKQFDKEVTLNFGISGDAIAGTDYTTIGTTIIFPALTSSITIPVEVIADDLVEPDETVILTLTGTDNPDVTITPTATKTATVTITNNDVAELSITATKQAGEDAADGYFIISSDVALYFPVTVTFSVSGDATEGTDYSNIGTAIILPAHASSVTIPIDVIADNLVDGDEEVTVTLTDTSFKYALITSSTNNKATVTILDNDVANLNITAAKQAAEDATDGLFTIHTDYQFDAPVTVTFVTSGGAAEGTDYQPIGTTTVFPPYTNSINLPMEVIADNLVESDETVIVTLTATTNPDVIIATAPDDKATITITDDDLAELTITAPRQAAEDATDGLFTITTDKQFDAPVTVTFGVDGTAISGTDYTSIGTTVVFPAFTDNITIPVPVIADELVESDETVIVTLSGTGNPDVAIATAPNNNATVTITDDDQAGLTITAARQATEDATNGLFTITTDKQFDAPVTVSFGVDGTAISGTDYTSIGTTFVFPAFTGSITIPVQVIADELVESDETVIVTLTGTGNPDVIIAETPENQAITTITDNDLAILTISASIQAAEDASNGLFTITTDKQFDAPVTINIEVTGDAIAGTDYTTIGSSMVFPPFAGSITIPILVIADGMDEGPETVTVTMTATGNPDVAIAPAPGNSAMVSITDNDPVPLIAFRTASSTGLESVAVVHLEVGLSAISSKQITVDYTVAGNASGSGTDFTLANGTLTINALSEFGTIDLEINDDLLGESDETIVVILSNPVNSALGTIILHTYIIIDNDRSGPRITTREVTGIAFTSGTGNWEITSLGGFDVTSQGVCWNTTGAPTIDDNKTDIGSTAATGTFSSAMTALAGGTTYYVRAHATNSIGTTYGNQVAFTTLFAGSWIGITSSEWTEPSNWAGGMVPDAETDVIIPEGVPRYPRIGATNSADCKNLTVEPGAALTIGSTDAGTGSLIVHGASTGVVTYQRFITGDKWHLLSPAASEGGISTFILKSDNAIYNRDIDGRIRYAVVRFNEANNVWDSYYTDDTSDHFIAGEGYSVRRITDGVVTFSGVLTSGTKTVPLANEGKGWSCVGNPYSSAIKMNTSADVVSNFLTANMANLDPSYAAAYVWDGNSGMFEVLGNSNYLSGHTVTDVLPSGQGFFLKAAGVQSSATFTASMQVHQPLMGIKSAETSWPGFELNLTSGDAAASTLVTFNDGMTNGLDPSYDAGLLHGNSGISVYTRLIEDNGVDFAVQCLPEQYKGVIIPLGISCPVDGQITFSAETPVLSPKCRVILEDRLNRKFTALDQGEAYTTSVTGDTQGSGRFFIHTSQETTGTGSILTAASLNLKVYPGNGLIYIRGNIDAPTRVRLSGISGQALGTYELKRGDLNVIPAAGLAQGVYILDITQGSRRQTSRIALIERY